MTKPNMSKLREIAWSWSNERQFFSTDDSEPNQTTYINGIFNKAEELAFNII